MSDETSYDSGLDYSNTESNFVEINNSYKPYVVNKYSNSYENNTSESNESCTSSECDESDDSRSSVKSENSSDSYNSSDSCNSSASYSSHSNKSCNSTNSTNSTRSNDSCSSSNKICKTKCDSDVKSILVYIVVENHKDHCMNHKSKELVKFFKCNKFFQTKVIDIPPPSSLDCCNNLTEKQALEIYRYNKILKKAARNHPNKYVLIIKDSAITITTPDLLETVIRYSFQYEWWQILYLNTWQDSTKMFTKRVDVECHGSMTSLVQTKNPHGTLALLFSPKGRDIVIGKRRMCDKKYFTPITLPLGDALNINIANSNIQAMCTVPNQFEYNLFDAKTLADIQCFSNYVTPSTGNVSGTTNKGNISIFWFIVIVLVAFLIVWALYILGSTNRKRKISTYKLEIAK